MAEFDDGSNFNRRKYSKDDLKEDLRGALNARRPAPIILTKAERERDGEVRDRERTMGSRSPVSKTPTIILRTREGEREGRAVSPNLQQRTPMVLKKETVEPCQPTYQLAPKPCSVQSTNPLAPAPKMKACVKLIDESLQFCEVTSDALLDQNDFLVVGVLGLQGVGKSTIMSLLASSEACQTEKEMCFKPQGLDQHETGTHCTNGIDLWVTQNRIMLLDTQPLLSASILDRMGNFDSMPSSVVSGTKKFSGISGSGPGVNLGVGTPGSSTTSTGAKDLGLLTNIEGAIEIQSLQLAAFILSVCHVVILVQDWFYDPNLLRFLQSAEMLKPPTPTTADDETLVEYFPHVMFLHNRSQPSEFSSDYVKMMQSVYKTSFAQSKLQIKSGVGIGIGNVINLLNPKTCGEPVNLFLLPNNTDCDKEDHGYQGHPGFQELIRKLRQHILGTKRQPLTHHPLSEKNWVLYASKVWDGIRKSTFFHEYTRLLP